MDVLDVAGDLLERITTLRSTVAGDIVNAEGVAATRVALRRVFDGFVLHRADSPDAPRRVDADLAFGVKGTCWSRWVADDARLGTMPAGTPVVERVPLELEPSGSIKATSRSTSVRAGFIPTRWGACERSLAGSTERPGRQPRACLSPVARMARFDGRSGSNAFSLG